MSLPIQHIIDAMESWAPPGTAQSYDNVGLQIGDRSRDVDRVLVGLDVTPELIDEAVALRCQLIISHHPLLFKPLKTLTPDGLESAMALRLAEERIALYSIHTNLDAARDGVSFALARDLGVTNPAFLSGLDGQIEKLVVFVPETHIDNVRRAVMSAGAGSVGAYRGCSFTSSGTGFFTPTEGTSPFTGTEIGQEESVDEIRLETEISSWNRTRILEALREVHPYEEVAYDLIPVSQKYRGAGIGAVGDLPESCSLETFLNMVCRVLGNPAVRYSGDLQGQIRRVAVCGGSGSDFIPLAVKAGADVYVTADISYHRYFGVMAKNGTFNMALVDAGHYETERMTERILVDFLSEHFDALTVERAKTRTSPVATFIGT